MRAVARHAALAGWHIVVPVAVTALTLGYVVPPTSDGSLAGGLVQHQPVLAAALVFLAAGAIVRAWSDVLPGARPLARASHHTRGRRIAIGAAVVLAAAAGLAVSRTFQTARVVSTSMVPTIFPGDRVWVDRRAYGPDEPLRRGDVVVFQRAGAGDGEPGALVKRVVGLPGDHIAMHDSHPVINGREVVSCDAGAFAYPGASQSSRGRLSIEWLDSRAVLTVQEPGPHDFVGYDVGPGEVFVLGDNRGVSNDSRSWLARPGVDASAIIGRVDRVVFGEDRRGGFDVARLWQQLGTNLELDGIDLAALRAGIERCLAAR